VRTETLILSGAVPAPIHRVFELMTNPALIPDWLPRCSNVVSQGPLTKGCRIKVNFNGRATQFEIVDLSPPTTFGWADRLARKGTRVFFHLQFSGGQTQLTMKSLWTPQTWRDWLAAKLFRRRSARRLFDGVLQNLRKLVTR
jgi:uncharacterized protein YndB with AHSA1/START domain